MCPLCWVDSLVMQWRMLMFAAELQVGTEGDWQSLTFCQTSAGVASTLLDLEVTWRTKNLKDCPNIWDKSSRWMTEQYWKRWQLWPDLYFTEWRPWRDTTYLLVTRRVNVKYPDVKMQMKAAPLIRANVCDRVTSWERGGLKHCWIHCQNLLMWVLNWLQRNVNHKV